jgi:hypothetical protein
MRGFGGFGGRGFFGGRFGGFFGVVAPYGYGFGAVGPTVTTVVRGSAIQNFMDNQGGGWMNQSYSPHHHVTPYRPRGCSSCG